MRTTFVAVCAACLACTAALAGADTLWLADGEGVSKVTSTRSTHVAVADVRKLAQTRDGGAWALSAHRLVRISREGRVRADIDLAAGGYGGGTSLAVDPYDDSVWIATDAKLLLHFMDDGFLAHGTSLPGSAGALAVALDQTPWFLVNGQLAHSPDGNSLVTVRVPESPDVAAPGFVFDSLREQAWIAGSHALWRLQPNRGMPASELSTGTDAVRAIALDARSGELWVIAGRTMKAIDQDGTTRVEVDVSALAQDDPVALHYDDELGSLLVQTEGRLARVSRDGQMLEDSQMPAGWFVATPPPFRIDPTLSLIRPPAGAATLDRSPVFTLVVGATCGGTACDGPPGYADDVQIVGEINGTPMSDPLVDPATGRVLIVPRLLLDPGVNRLTVQATDRFGHRAQLDASFAVLDREPDARARLDGERGGEATEPADVILKAPNKLPIVTLTSPASGAAYSAGASITIAATASDPDGSIAKVVFYRGGSTEVGTATSAPYQAVWQNVPAGNYTITAKAYDNRKGTATSAPVTIAVTNNQLPAVAVASPTQGEFFGTGEPIQLAATASDPDGTVAKVEFLDGSASIGFDESAPFALTWTGAQPGLHSIVARATDSAGGISHSASIDIVVGAPPIVVVKSPLSCSSVDGPLDLVLAADAISTTGTIARVEFFDGETLVGVSHGAPWHVTLAGASTGDHLITARAIDDHGLATTSRPSLVSVRTANQPPTVVLTSPGEGAQFALGSTVNLAATATDNDGVVAAVEFRIGSSSGSLVGRATSTPFSVPWTNMTAGTYTLVAVAFDDRDATATSAPVHVTIAPNVPPTVSLTAPVPNALYAAPATVILDASASDSDGSIARIDFYAGTTLVGSSTVAPFTSTWNGVVSGDYSLTARATDNLGAIATSAPVTIRVGSNAPPAVGLIAPTAGTSYFAPATIALNANASDGDGTIAKVDFFANGAWIGTATAAPYSFVWDGVGGGAYSISATAVDNLGATSTTPVVAITVRTAPELEFTANLDGATVNDDNVLVQGSVSAPANSALTVNDVVTRIDDYGRFHANDVPLGPGGNTVTAIVTTQDGQSTSRSITVNSTGRGPFSVQASPTEGLNSLQVSFTVDNPGGVAFKQINFDLDNDGSPNVIATPDQFVDGMLTVTATYPAGTWLAVITVYDDADDILYSTSKSIVVLLPGALQSKLRGIYDGMLARLKGGNIAGALTAFTGAANAKYRTIFTQLQPALASVVDQLGEVREVNFGMDVAEFNVVRNTPEGAKRFLLYLIRAEDGIWRIDGM